ncbi:MAG: hypothetical protein A2381_11320 [Bdellovibrionales bacterium RIFOXYB1_FULL_37_110]|nr:MAG: hypothetical protein A2417_11625 [Bdellovibrionales bacterium RIFOXYC1_FULL_37_79]OFZ57282.1 MAG: hypothetical protein A2381_11320 [Bdellovibrionales bacterium RIFOXYB1_FULL_37_110]OFZ62178.1 MAG: hypothetical protein A2577_13870 [Bdellovibrionales bacterium RIFOXYD1_FULL_36_51]
MNLYSRNYFKNPPFGKKIHISKYILFFVLLDYCIINIICANRGWQIYQLVLHWGCWKGELI